MLACPVSDIDQPRVFLQDLDMSRSSFGELQKYEAGKTGASKGEVKSAVKSVGNSRKKVEGKLGTK